MMIISIVRLIISVLNAINIERVKRTNYRYLLVLKQFKTYFIQIGFDL